MKFIQVLFIVFITNSLFGQNPNDSLKNLFHKHYDKAKTYIVKNPEKAIYHYEEAQEILEKILRDKELKSTFSFIKKVDTNKPSFSKDSLSQHIISNESSFNKQEVYDAYKNVIQKMSFNNVKDSQLKYQHELVKYAEKQNDTSSIIYYTIQLADLYTNLMSEENAEKYFLKAKNLIDNSNDKDPIVLVKWNQRFASLKNTFLDFNNAIKYSKIALNHIKPNDNDSKGTSYNELGYAYFHSGQKKLASESYDKAIIAWEKINDKQSLALAYLNKAKELMVLKKHNAAILLLNKSIQYAIDHNISWIYESGNRRLAEEYSAIGNYKKAFLSERVSKYLSYFNIKKSKQENALKIEVEYETIEKNKLLAKQKFELLSIEKAKEKETFIKNVIFGVSILLLVGLFIFYKNAKKLSKQKDEINNKNLDLKVTLKQNEVLLKEVHHRVKNNLTILSGLFYLQEKETKNKEDENFLKECQNRINSMAMVHQKLYQTGDMSKINFGLYCKELLSSLSNSFFSKEKEIVFKIDHDEVFLDIEKAIPLALIITELVTNSFKYAFINKVSGEIGITLKKDLKKLKVEVYDDGEGLKNNFSLIETKTLGMRLVGILSKQLFASIEYKNHKKSSFFIIFDL